MKKSNVQKYRSHSNCFASLVLIVPMMVFLPSDSIWQALARFVVVWSLLLGAVVFDFKHTQPARLESRTGLRNSNP